jgi:cation transport regulator
MITTFYLVNTMPYKTLDDLPDSVKNNLPQHAQEIYKEAFNHSWVQYANPKKRRSQESREEVAHKVAWSAVKNTYQKNDAGQWVRKEAANNKTKIYKIF